MTEEYKDPDESNDESKFSWDEDYQRMILSLLLVDRIFLVQSIGLIKPAYFPNKAHDLICSILFDFYNKYKILPKVDFLKQEIKDKTKNNAKSQLYYLTELEMLEKYFVPGMESREYLLDKITGFAKIQALRIAYGKVSGVLSNKGIDNDDAWNQSYDILRNAMNVSHNFDLGLEYFKNKDERYNRLLQMQEATEVFITGFESIDNGLRAGGLTRGEIGSFIAGSGVGKSIALACVASANVRRGRKVLYITLELSEDKVAERFDAILTGEPIILLQDRKEEVFQNLDSIVEDFDDKNLLLIKGFPAGTADTNKIRAYISQVKFYGFTPDVVIVDYVGEMKTHDEIKTYESREKIVRELRALAIEEKFAVFTAMQPNRGSKEAEEELPLDDRHLADSFGQIRPLDACWSINVSKIEHDLHIGRIYVIKHRDGKTKYTFYVEFDRNNLRIQEISYDNYKNKRTLYKNRKITDVSIDDVVGGVDPSKFKESDELDDDDDDAAAGVVKK